MIFGSHNSWSYLKSKRWWLKPFSFIIRCQNVNIKNQYLCYNIRCFDLRINFDKNGKLYISHGSFIFNYTEEDLMKDLEFLNNRTERCYVRMIYEVRTKKRYTEEKAKLFREKCKEFEEKFPRLIFWCGKSIARWNELAEYKFKNEDPSCEELYSSVCSPKYLDDWFPWLFAKLNNKKIKKLNLNSDILLFDFVNLE